MSRKTVKHDMDLANLPPLTAKQEAELKALAAKPDSAIDHGDIPPLDDAFWRNAVRNSVYRPIKTSTTVRLDTDVLLWLRSQGKGYQSRINAILRREMLASIKPRTASRRACPPRSSRWSWKARWRGLARILPTIPSAPSPPARCRTGMPTSTNSSKTGNHEPAAENPAWMIPIPVGLWEGSAALLTRLLISCYDKIG